MKQIAKSHFWTILCISIPFLLTACNRKNETQFVEWQEEKMFQLPQPVIDFFYNADPTTEKLFTILDSSYKVNEKNMEKTSNLTETHYTIEINHQPILVRERDYRSPYLIFNGKLYLSKSLIRKGKLMTPQDLFIYSVDLKTVLK
jgi:hypothetical protein